MYMWLEFMHTHFWLMSCFVCIIGNEHHNYQSSRRMLGLSTFIKFQHTHIKSICAYPFLFAIFFFFYFLLLHWDRFEFLELACPKWGFCFAYFFFWSEGSTLGTNFIMYPMHFCIVVILKSYFVFLHALLLVIYDRLNS